MRVAVDEPESPLQQPLDGDTGFSVKSFLETLTQPTFAYIA